MSMISAPFIAPFYTLFISSNFGGRSSIFDANVLITIMASIGSDDVGYIPLLQPIQRESAPRLHPKCLSQRWLPFSFFWGDIAYFPQGEPTCKTGMYAMTLGFGLYPLTQLVLPLNLQEGCCHNLVFFNPRH